MTAGHFRPVSVITQVPQITLQQTKIKNYSRLLIALKYLHKPNITVDLHQSLFLKCLTPMAKSKYPHRCIHHYILFVEFEKKN